MLDILFFSRRSNHAKYFQKLHRSLSINSEVHLTGLPHLQSFTRISEARTISLDDIISRQIFRKAVSLPHLFKYEWVKTIYRTFLLINERCRLMKYLALLERKKPNKVALWNGQKLPNATIVKAAQFLSIDIVYFENGLLPNTATCDLKGVNAKNSLPQNPNFYLDFQPNNSLISTPLVERPLNKHRKKEQIAKLPEKYLFLPFQVPNDTQIAVNSTWIRSMEQLLEETVAAVHNTELNDLYIVVKAHPSWKNSFAHLHKKYQNVIFANNNNTEVLIKEAVAVITINSTVGLEAILHNKKVITLGDACYNIKQLVQHAPNANALVAALQNIERWQINEKLRAGFLSFLHEVYTVPTKWSQADTKHISAIEARLTQQDLYHQYLD